MTCASLQEVRFSFTLLSPKNSVASWTHSAILGRTKTEVVVVVVGGWIK